VGSSDIGVVACVDGEWVNWSMPEGGHAVLPMDENDDDTWPVGLALDFSQTKKLPGLNPDSDQIPPSPRLLILTNSGILLMYNCICTVAENDEYYGKMLSPEKRVIVTPPQSIVTSHTQAPNISSSFRPSKDIHPNSQTTGKDTTLAKKPPTTSSISKVPTTQLIPSEAESKNLIETKSMIQAKFDDIILDFESDFQLLVSFSQQVKNNINTLATPSLTSADLTSLTLGDAEIIKRNSSSYEARLSTLIKGLDQVVIDKEKIISTIDLALAQCEESKKRLQILGQPVKASELIQRLSPETARLKHSIEAKQKILENMLTHLEELESAASSKTPKSLSKSSSWVQICSTIKWIRSSIRNLTKKIEVLEFVSGEGHLMDRRNTNPVIHEKQKPVFGLIGNDVYAVEADTGAEYFDLDFEQKYLAKLKLRQEYKEKMSKAILNTNYTTKLAKSDVRQFPTKDSADSSYKDAKHIPNFGDESSIIEASFNSSLFGDSKVLPVVVAPIKMQSAFTMQSGLRNNIGNVNETPSSSATDSCDENESEFEKYLNENDESEEVASIEEPSDNDDYNTKHDSESEPSPVAPISNPFAVNTEKSNTKPVFSFGASIEMSSQKNEKLNFGIADSNLRGATTNSTSVFTLKGPSFPVAAPLIKPDGDAKNLVFGTPGVTSAKPLFNFGDSPKTSLDFGGSKSQKGGLLNPVNQTNDRKEDINSESFDQLSMKTSVATTGTKTNGNQVVQNDLSKPKSPKEKLAGENAPIENSLDLDIAKATESLPKALITPDKSLVNTSCPQITPRPKTPNHISSPPVAENPPARSKTPIQNFDSSINHTAFSFAQNESQSPDKPNQKVVVTPSKAKSPKILDDSSDKGQALDPGEAVSRVTDTKIADAITKNTTPPKETRVDHARASHIRDDLKIDDALENLGTNETTIESASAEMIVSDENVAQDSTEHNVEDEHSSVLKQGLETSNFFGSKIEPKNSVNPMFDMGKASGQNTSLSSAFGQSLPQTSVLGQSTNTSTAFGKTSTPVSFGQSPTTSAFEQKPINALGQSIAAGQKISQSSTPSAFGQTSPSSSAFGQTTSPTFSQSSKSLTFGQASNNATAFSQHTTPTSFGQSPSLFGQTSAPASVFGQTSTPTAAFGQTSAPTSAFGQTPTQTAPLGQTSAPAPAFGQTSTPTAPFGQMSAPAPAFGQMSAPAPAFGQTSSPAPAFGQTSTLAPAFGQTSMTASPFQSILQKAQAVSTQSGFSSFANSSTGFASLAPTGFGANRSVFGQSAFGQPANNQQQSAFGQTAYNQQQSAFGQTSISQQQSAFGQTSNGQQQSAFGQNSNNQLQSAFGQNANNQQQSAFGRNSNNQLQSAFGQNSNNQLQSAFGQNANNQQQSAFGQNSNNQQQSAFGQNSNNQQSSAFIPKYNSFT
jgi:hypothetical protein